MDDIIDIKIAAAMLGIHTVTLSRLASQGRIPAAKILGRWRFSQTKLLDFLHDEMDSNLKRKKEDASNS